MSKTGEVSNESTNSKPIPSKITTNNTQNGESAQIPSETPLETPTETPLETPSKTPSLPPNKLTELDLNDLTVEIRNLKFFYSRKAGNLLNDINLTFPRSAIYGFLGPSGCGKTTIIKLIVGLLRPTSGTIKVYGRKVNDPQNKIPGIGIGYMPQDFALYEECTILETLNYFSRIYGLSKEYMKKRIEFLIKFLELPDPNRMVGVLSGGQRRRVSLAVAIVHNPPFLILDEPTVGVDPMLRERIWGHLLSLSTDEKTSILITTHYIEECRRAHVIGLMRGGKLLVENSPYTLLTHFQTDNLEEVFLRVCRSQESESKLEMPLNLAQMAARGENKSQKVRKVWSNANTGTNMCNKYMALIHKNFMRLWRNKLQFIVTIIMPTISIILFCLCIGKKPFDLDIAVYNEEREGNNQYEQTMSYRLLGEVDKNTLLLKYYTTQESAIKSVEDGTTYGALVVPKDFSAALMRRSGAPNLSASDDDIKDSTIEFYGDLTDLMLYQTMYKTLLAAEQKFQKNLIIEMQNQTPTNSPNKPNPDAILPLIKFVDPPIYGDLNPNFRYFVTPGIIICVTYLLAVAMTALAIVVERKEGLLERTLVAGVKIHEVLIAQLIVQQIVIIFQIILLLIVVFGVFHIKNEGNYILVFVMCLLQGMAGMTYGLVISSISANEAAAIMLSMGSFVPYLVLSGIIWPLEGMDARLRVIAYVLPQTLPVISLRNIMLKGWFIDRTYVWLGYLTSVIWIIVFLIMSVILESFRNDI